MHSEKGLQNCIHSFSSSTSFWRGDHCCPHFKEEEAGPGHTQEVGKQAFKSRQQGPDRVLIPALWFWHVPTGTVSCGILLIGRCDIIWSPWLHLARLGSVCDPDTIHPTSVTSVPAPEVKALRPWQSTLLEGLHLYQHIFNVIVCKC